MATAKYIPMHHGTAQILRCGRDGSYLSLLYYYLRSVDLCAHFSTLFSIVTDEFGIFYAIPWSLNLMIRVEKS